MKFQLGIVAGAAAFCLGSSPINGATPELIPHGNHFHTNEGELKNVADIEPKRNVFLAKAEGQVPELMENLRKLVEQAGGNLAGKKIPAVDKRLSSVTAKNETDVIAVMVDAKDNDVVNVNTVVLQDGPAGLVDVIVSAKDNVDANINTAILEDLPGGFPTGFPTGFPYSVPTPPPFPPCPESTEMLTMLTEFPPTSIETGMITESIETGIATNFHAPTEMPEMKSLLPADKITGAN